MAAMSRRLFVSTVVCGCTIPAAALAQTSPSGKYVCPPCGCEEDGKEFDAPGACPAAGCGMVLIPKPQDAPPQPQPAPL